MWLLIISVSIFFLLLRILNEKYYLLAGCRRVRTVDGSALKSKITVIQGKTIFGNNYDILGSTSSSTYKFARDNVKIANGKSYLMHFLLAPILSITTAEDAEEIFQSQAIIAKSAIYNLLVPFLGMGLLISKNEQWQFRRKVLTPAFHFNILLTFVEIFKEETNKFIGVLKAKNNEDVNLSEVIPSLTLNNVCETALGVKLDEVPGSDYYRKAVNELEPLLVNRMCNPIMYFDWVYALTKDYRKQKKIVKVAHDFSSKIIEKKRLGYQNQKGGLEKFNDLGQKQRYAMLDTLLDAEMRGLIDHQGICDEVNTFMFEGYDTTSICLMMTILSLALHQDVQQKCFEEVQNWTSIDDMTLFDFTKLEYLECVLKEILRMYPSVPFIARHITKDTVVNGLILPANSQVHIHVLDIMRDERHWPNPNKFDPDRFKPDNTIHRHPFAFVPFSAGARNCIGQKFAMLEMKVLLVAVLMNFKIHPVTRLEDVTLENGIVLRANPSLFVKFSVRTSMASK